MTIREATIDDVDALVMLGAQFLAASRYGTQFANNGEQMEMLATYLIVQDDGVILVADDDARGLVGMLALLCSRHPWSAEAICGELAFFVDPDARGSTGVRLLKHGEQWAKARGAIKMQLVAPEGHDRVMALYEALDYRVIEHGFMRTL